MSKYEGIFTSGPQEGEEPEVLITTVFKSVFVGDCALDPWHKIKRGDLIGKMVHGSNPLIPRRGYACKLCVREYPRYEEE